MKHILVTGGLGFIGTNLVEHLLKNKFRVTVWDNFYTAPHGKLELFKTNPLFAFENVDIREPASFQAEVIINLACPASPPHYQRDPIYTWETSVLGIRNLLKIAKDSKAMLLHASTSEVYGNPLEHPQKETYWGNVNPVGIRSCYDEGKRAAETLITDHRRMHGTDARMFRIFNTYGPHMLPDDGRVVSNFIVQAILKQPLTIYGTGNQTRSFCYVSDLVDGIMKLMEALANPETPVNLGNPHEFSLLELVKVIEEVRGEKLQVVHKELPQDDPEKRKPDISLAKKLLNWEPKIQLKEGIEQTVKYFESIV